jgi:hypothetical protein
MIRASLLALALLAPLAAVAQQPEPEESVVVTGRRTEEAVRAFVGAMSVAPRGNDALARWDRRICPGVVGLRTRYAQFMIDRLAQRAFDVDLDVGRPGCRPNILIVVTPDPDAVAQDLYENHAGSLGYFEGNTTATRGRDALRDTFVNSDAPVRWWHVSQDVSVDGMPMRTNGASCNANEAIELIHCFPAAYVSPTRLRASFRQDFGAAFVIVDANRLPETGPDFNALADYVAMVAMAQLDPAADVSAYPTVLNLWNANGAAAPRAMTDWDVSYLRGLYAASTRDARDARTQEYDISREMMRDDGG